MALASSTEIDWTGTRPPLKTANVDAPTIQPSDVLWWSRGYKDICWLKTLTQIQGKSTPTDKP